MSKLEVEVAQKAPQQAESVFVLEAAHAGQRQIRKAGVGYHLLAYCLQALGREGCSLDEGSARLAGCYVRMGSPGGGCEIAQRLRHRCRVRAS